MLIFSLILLVGALIFGGLGFFVLPPKKRGFPKVMFYVLLMMAVITGFFGLMQAAAR